MQLSLRIVIKTIHVCCCYYEIIKLYMLHIRSSVNVEKSNILKGSVGWCLQDSVYKSSDVVVLLDEIRSCQDVLNRIANMKLGYLGTALVTIINQVCREWCIRSVLSTHCNNNNNNNDPICKAPECQKTSMALYADKSPSLSSFIIFISCGSGRVTLLSLEQQFLRPWFHVKIKLF